MAASAVPTQAAAPLSSSAPFEVTGEIVATAPRLRVQLVVRNRSEQQVSSLAVKGEWLGQGTEARIAEAHIATGLAAGSSGSVVLDFDGTGLRPGVYALVLLLEHATSGAPDAAGNPPLASQRAGLLLAAGEGSAEAGAHGVVLPVVRLEPEPCLLAVSGSLELAVESADAAPHRIRLRAFTPRGLRADGDAVALDVPATGRMRARLPLVRAGAPRGTEHSVVVVAETDSSPYPGAALVSATVRVADGPSRVPRLRPAVWVLAALLLLVVVVVEIRARARA